MNIEDIILGVGGLTLAIVIVYYFRKLLLYLIKIVVP